MRVLLLADIHGNLPAFEAVLSAADAMKYDELWCLGDVVGYGPLPNECVDLLRSKPARVIVGNHDAKVVSSRKIRQIIDQKKEAYKVFVFSWTHRMLTPGSVSYLKALPKEMRLEQGGQRILLVHGSPRGMDDGITVHTPQERLAHIADEAQADVILAGHTHEAFVRQAGRTIFINPGSVGRPFDGDTRASFSILEFTDEGVRAQNYRAAYDISGVLQEMHRQEFPAVLVKAFAGACSPADVLPEGAKGDLIDEALKFGERCRYEKAHALKVAALALRLFDELKDLHGYGQRPRELLQAGALLHDIGIMHGADGHHKASRDMILEDRVLPLADRERVVVALLARYHRRSLPAPDHKYFHLLPDHHQCLVERLGGILRLADGLDRMHQGLVHDVTVEVGGDFVRMHLSAEKDIAAELEFGKAKSDLFERGFARRVILDRENV